VIDLLTGGLEDEVIDSLPLTEIGIEHLALGNRLVWPCRIDFIGGSAIHPVIGSAESSAFWADDTDVAGSKGLTKGAGVKDVRRLIRHAFNPGVPFSIDFSRLGEHLFNLIFFRVDFDLNLVKNSSEVLVEFSMEDFS
jgi:hypothetical protein